MSPRTRLRLAGVVLALAVAATPTTSWASDPSEGRPLIGVHWVPGKGQVRFCLAEAWDLQSRHLCYRLCKEDAIDARVIHRPDRFFEYDAKRCPALFDDEKEM